jgi:membrane protein implicated in regulation of membrane protease activity
VAGRTETKPMQKKDALKRYVLFQIPELIITLLILLIVRHFFDLSFWIILLILSASILKDIIMFPFVWKSYLVQDPQDHANIKGQICIATEDFEGQGMVRLNGELWKARSSNPVQKDDRLIVKKIDGLQLFVGPSTEEV